MVTILGLIFWCILSAIVGMLGAFVALAMCASASNERLPTKVRCVDCGALLDWWDRDHWEVCPNHPARTRVAELERQLSALKAPTPRVWMDTDGTPQPVTWTQTTTDTAADAHLTADGEGD